MRQVKLKRDPVAPDGLFGHLDTGTLELWTVENHALFVPAGTYSAKGYQHPKHGWCYELMNVTDRSACLIHTANWEHELRGCIAPGRAIVDLALAGGGKKRGVSSSHDALAALLADLGKRPFELVILSAVGAGQVGPCQA